MMTRASLVLPAALILALTLAPTTGPPLQAQAAVPAEAEEQAGVELLPLPDPDLSPLEDAVAAQLRRFRELAERTLADPEASLRDRAEVLGELGQHYHAYDLVEAATDCYRNAAHLFPADFRWPYLLGVLAQESGDLETASELYQGALAIRPDNVAAQVHLGEILLGLNRLDEARALLEALLRAEPETPSALAILGQIALSKRDYAAAAQILERALQDVPEANRLHYPLALAYRGLGDTEKAKEHLELRGSVGIRPPDPLVDELKARATGERVHLLRGRMAFRAGRYQEAADAFARAVAARPESARARVNLGSALALAGEEEAAMEQYRKALELEPENVTVHFNLGYLLVESDPQKAYEHLSTTVRLQPKDARARLELGRLLRRAGEGEPALEHLAQASLYAPFDEDTRLEHAGLLVELGRYREAGEQLADAHGLAPTSGLLAHALARFLAAVPELELRDGERALELARAVFEAQPTSRHAETLAKAYAESGRCNEAAEWQRKLLEALPDSAEESYRRTLRRSLASYESGPPCRPPGASEGPPPP